MPDEAEEGEGEEEGLPNPDSLERNQSSFRIIMQTSEEAHSGNRQDEFFMEVKMSTQLRQMLNAKLTL